MTEIVGMELTSPNYDGHLKQTSLGVNTHRRSIFFKLALKISSIRIVSYYREHYPDGGFLLVLYKNIAERKILRGELCLSLTNGRAGLISSG